MVAATFLKLKVSYLVALPPDFGFFASISTPWSLRILKIYPFTPGSA